MSCTTEEYVELTIFPYFETKEEAIAEIKKSFKATVDEAVEFTEQNFYKWRLEQIQLDEKIEAIKKKYKNN